MNVVKDPMPKFVLEDLIILFYVEGPPYKPELYRNLAYLYRSREPCASLLYIFETVSNLPNEARM